MARIVPTLPSAARYRGVVGDRKVVVQDLAIAGTYAAATAAADGVVVTPALVGLSVIDYIEVIPKFTADAATKKVTWLGPSSTGPEHVLALIDKDDDLQAANGAVTGVTCTVKVTGK